MEYEEALDAGDEDIAKKASVGLKGVQSGGNIQQEKSRKHYEGHFNDMQSFKTLLANQRILKKEEKEELFNAKK